MAERGREQLEEHQSSAEPGKAAGEKEAIVDSEYGGGQDTEPLRPSTTGASVTKDSASSAHHIRELMRLL